jgi:putative FmdB family regulatory protein
VPIYEYRCQRCGHSFEELVRVGQTAPCPACGNPEPKRQLSMCAISTAQTRQVAKQSGRKIAGKMRKEKNAADAEYVRKHTSDHH